MGAYKRTLRYDTLTEQPLETAQDRVARRGTSVRIVNGSEAVGSLPHSYASKCVGRETKARYYMQYEQPLGDGSPAEGLPSLAPSKEAPSLPTRAPSYEAKRGAPKAQDRCASKRHPFYVETSMPTVQSAAPYRQRKRSRGIFAALVCDVTSRLRNESTVLHIIRAAPWRRGAPKAQDGSPKRYERQWSGEGLVASDLGLVT